MIEMSTYSTSSQLELLDVVVFWSQLVGMDTLMQTTATTPDTTPSRTGASGSSPLPADFDVAAWVNQVCQQSGVSVEVTDPVALAKLRTLTSSTDH